MLLNWLWNRWYYTFSKCFRRSASGDNVEGKVSRSEKTQIEKRESLEKMERARDKANCNARIT